MKTFIKWLAKKWHPKNTFQDLLSTFIGLLGMLVMFYYFYEQGITFQEFLEGIGFFAFFCGINISKIGGGTTASCVLIMLGLSVMGCKTIKPGIDTKTVLKDSTIISIKTVYDTIPIVGDSIKIYLTNPYAPSTITGITTAYKPYKKEILSKAKRSKLVVSQDSLGNKTIDCLCLAYLEIIARQDSTIQKISSEKTETHNTEVVYETRWYDWLARALALAFVIIIINSIFNKKG